MKNLLIIMLSLLSCTTDYRLHTGRNITHVLDTEDSVDVLVEDTLDTPEVFDTPEVVDEPDIEIVFVPDGVTSVKPGCSASGRFVISNVGTADLIINELDAYASVPLDAIITSNYAPLPLTIIPGGFHEIKFDVNQTDNIEDKIIVVAKSNDPDESIAYLDTTYSSDMGAPAREEFVIQESKAADVLMVVDNSCSMSEEQSTLASNAQLFIDSLSLASVDFRIAVITTDRYSFVGPVITNSTTDPGLELSRQVNVGTYGSPYEEGIRMASMALAPGGMAAPGGSFLRHDARLSIIWISDEDDFSGGTTYTWSSDFWSKKSSPGDVSVWGIVGDPVYGCMAAAPGDRYYDLITAMGGGWSSICSSDWGTPMASVAGRIGIDSTLELTGNPIASSIRVFVDGIESFDWVYVVSSNVISFNPGHIPAVGVNVMIEYSIYGNCN